MAVAFGRSSADEVFKRADGSLGGGRRSRCAPERSGGPQQTRSGGAEAGQSNPRAASERMHLNGSINNFDWSKLTIAPIEVKLVTFGNPV